MAICGMCQEQAKKALRGDAHQYLAKVDAPRVFKGGQSKGYEEQDYQCQVCQAKFTRSNNRNDLAWTLWQG
jgi:thymidine kinase